MIRTVAAVLALASLAHPARGEDAPTRRFAVVAGASDGGAGRTPLRYATSDARDVSRVLRRLGGVARGDLVLVEDPDAARLHGALDAIAAEAERARGRGQRVELFLYYSGHSDERGLLLGASRVDYAELRRALDRVPADVRVAILDSCASGAITRAKGGVHRPPFLLDASSRVTGHAFLTSSAADEAAQESDRLRASFFTHALLTGLRGAADATGDGVVTLNEAYQFAFRETLASTEATQGGAQHATYDIGLVGSGDVVLTDLRRADAVLVVPEAVDGRVFVRSAQGQLIAELRKVRGARVELALEEGRYEVRVLHERMALGGTIALAGSDRLVLDEARLWPVPLEASAARGSGGDAPPQAAPAGLPGGSGVRDLVALGVPTAGALPASSRASPPHGPVDAADDVAWVLSARGGGAVSRRVRSPTGVLAEAAIGAWAARWFGVELSAGYLRVSGRTTGRLPYGIYGYTDEVRDVVTAVPTRLSLQAGLPGGTVRPYVLAGAGATWARIERFALRPGVDVPNPPRRLWDERLFMSFHAGAGTAVRLTRSTSATVELRYAFGPAETLLNENVKMDLFTATVGVAWTP